MQLIQPPVQLAEMRRAIPNLGWARYPRSITTLSPELAQQVRYLVKSRNRVGRQHHDVFESPEKKGAPLESLQTLALPREQLDYKIQTQAKVLKAKRTESKLVEDYENWLKEKGRKLLRHRYRNLICDAYEEQTRNLIEAKSSATREYIRMGVGQLLDYAFQGRKLYRRPNMALLLPTRPNLKMLEWLKPLRISLVWKQGRTFKDNAGGQFSST